MGRPVFIIGHRYREKTMKALLVYCLMILTVASFGGCALKSALAEAQNSDHPSIEAHYGLE